MNPDHDTIMTVLQRFWPPTRLACGASRRAVTHALKENARGTSMRRQIVGELTLGATAVLLLVAAMG